MIYRNRSIAIHKKLSLSGILAALIVISLMAAVWLPTNKLFFLAVSSLFVSVMIIKVDLASAITLYISSSILAFLLIPAKSIFHAYLVFFGFYGIVKFLCEQLKNFFKRWIVKLVAFNISLLIAYFFASFVLTSEISVKLPIWILWIIGQAVFILYDLMYTLFINFYYERLDKVIRQIFK